MLILSFPGVLSISFCLIYYSDLDLGVRIIGVKVNIPNMLTILSAWLKASNISNYQFKKITIIGQKSGLNINVIKTKFMVFSRLNGERPVVVHDAIVDYLHNKDTQWALLIYLWSEITKV